MSIFSVQPYEEAHRNEWDQFVFSSNNGTLMHMRGFLAYHGDEFADYERSVMVYKKNKLVAVCPLYIKEEPVKFGLFHIVSIKNAYSPVGASFGGIVIPRQLSINDANEIVTCFIDYLRSQGVQRCLIVPTPKAYENVLNDYVEYFMLQKGFMLTNMELTSCSRVDQYPDALSHAAKKALRKGLGNGVIAQETDDIETFHRILCENRQKFDASPAHTVEDVQYLKETYPDRVKICLVSHGNTNIASALLFLNSPKTLSVHYWAHLEEHQALRPINVLVDKVFEIASDCGATYVDFGIQTTGCFINQGGSRMKESFGGQGVFRNHYEIQFV
jgi:predicted N-acyltransferase